MSRDVFTHCSRFVGIIGSSRLAVLDRRDILYNCTRGSSRATSWEAAAGSAKPIIWIASEEFGKDAPTHHSVEGPFLTVYISIRELELISRFLQGKLIAFAAGIEIGQ